MWDENTDIIQEIHDFCVEAKQHYLRRLSEPPPRLVVPAWLVEGWSQEKLDAYWLEVG